MQGLGGLAPGLSRGATMSGNKGGAAADPSPIKFLQGGYEQGGAATAATFTAPKAGLYQFAAWGAGGSTGGGNAGGGGALAIRTVRLSFGQSVAMTIGSAGGTAASTVTFLDGVMTAGGGSNGTGGGGGAGGVATGGDINVNGSAAVTTTGGAAGSYGAFSGGAMQTVPGGGSSGSSIGAGALIAVLYAGA